MAAYPTSLAPQLNQVPEDGVAGSVTPSHGGMIGGHEFDLPISQTAANSQPLPPQPPVSLPTPIPRSLQPSNKPRPVSMPPQFGAAPGAAGTGSSTSASETKERSRPSANDTTSSRRHRDGSSSRPTRSNRILGDYTLSKTLGAGSMGKVKLATHNISGEKVRGCLHV